MKNKLSIWISGAYGAIASVGGWFITLPPEQQNSFVAPLIAVVPVKWQVGIAAVLKISGAVSGLYATFKAAQSGPTTQLPTKQ